VHGSWTLSGWPESEDWTYCKYSTAVRSLRLQLCLLEPCHHGTTFFFKIHNQNGGIYILLSNILSWGLKRSRLKIVCSLQSLITACCDRRAPPPHHQLQLHHRMPHNVPSWALEPSWRSCSYVILLYSFKILTITCIFRNKWPGGIRRRSLFFSWGSHKSLVRRPTGTKRW
jgi:hypothetical protein